jgi:hypothetical protein
VGSESNLQRAVSRFEKRANGFNMRISAIKTKTTAYKEKSHIRHKTGKDNKTTEQVSSLNYLERTLRQKTTQSTKLKFYKSASAYAN